MYYLPVEEGGLGIRSLEAEMKRARAKMDVQARNDVSYTRGAKGEATVQVGVVEAAWRRYEREPKTEETKGKVTMCAAVAEARQFLQIQVRPTEKGIRMASAHGQDRERMAAAKEGGSVAVYTDGSTMPGDRPTAGWG